MVKKRLNKKKNLFNLMGIIRRGNLRFTFGDLDIISALVILLGIYLTQTGYNTIGWILIVIGILKQFSGK